MIRFLICCAIIAFILIVYSWMPARGAQIERPLTNEEMKSSPICLMDSVGCKIMKGKP